MGNAKASIIGEVLDVRLVLTSYGIGLVDKHAIITTLCNNTMQYFMIYNGKLDKISIS